MTVTKLNPWCIYNKQVGGKIPGIDYCLTTQVENTPEQKIWRKMHAE